MDRLSACYFCGAALDEALSTYPAVPTDLDPDPATQREVVLCAGCREKLATVVEPIVAVAAEDGRADRRPEASEDERSGEQTAAASEDGAPATASARTETHPPAAERGANGTGAVGDAGADGASDGGAGTGSATHADATSPAETTADADATTGADTTPDADAASGAGDTQNGHAERPADAPEDVDSPGGSEAAERSDSEAGGATAGRVADDRSDVDEEPSLTALEYNRVVRLLQNREFPVDRQSFKTVALSAYDLSEEEFEAVVDAAVQRDIVAESGDQLVAPQEN